MTPSSLGFSGDTRLMDPSVPCSQDLYVAEALSTLESWRSRYNQVVKDKGDLELEIIVLNEYTSVLGEGVWANGRRGCASARRQATRDSSRRSHSCHLVSSGQGLHRTELWAALGWAFWLDPGSWCQPPPQHPTPRQALCRGLLCSHLGLSWAPVCTAWEMGTGTQEGILLPVLGAQGSW